MNPERLPLLLAIVVAPRATMRRILDTRGTRGALALVLLVAIAASFDPFDVAALRNAIAQLGAARFAIIVIVGILLGLLAGVLLWLFISGMATLAGRFLGGSATFAQARTAIAWGATPFLFSLLYKIPAMLLWPSSFARRAQPGLEIGDGPIRFNLEALDAMSIPRTAAYVVCELLIVVWYFVVGSQTLAEAEGVSSWVGFGNLLLAFVLPVVIAVVIAIAAALAF